MKWFVFLFALAVGFLFVNESYASGGGVVVQRQRVVLRPARVQRVVVRQQVVAPLVVAQPFFVAPQPVYVAPQAFVAPSYGMQLQLNSGGCGALLIR